MTVTFSVATPEYLILAADAAVSLDFADHREYETGRKLHRPARAIVTTWGARDANNIGELLARPEVSGLPADELAKEILRYLREEYDPRAMGLSNVGYHIGGFDANGRARLFHVFYEPDGFNDTTPPGGLYELQDQSPGEGRWRVFLYNGRNDLAHSVVATLLQQVKEGRPLRFDLRRFDDMWRFAHMVVRYAAELTPEVGPPFVMGAASGSASVVKSYYEWTALSSEDAAGTMSELKLEGKPRQAAV